MLLLVKEIFQLSNRMNIQIKGHNHNSILNKQIELESVSSKLHHQFSSSNPLSEEQNQTYPIRSTQEILAKFKETTRYNISQIPQHFKKFDVLCAKVFNGGGVERMRSKRKNVAATDVTGSMTLFQLVMNITARTSVCEREQRQKVSHSRIGNTSVSDSYKSCSHQRRDDVMDRFSTVLYSSGASSFLSSEAPFFINKHCKSTLWNGMRIVNTIIWC